MPTSSNGIAGGPVGCDGLGGGAVTGGAGGAGGGGGGAGGCPKRNKLRSTAGASRFGSSDASRSGSGNAPSGPVVTGVTGLDVTAVEPA
jgi:hypothetical protein